MDPDPNSAFSSYREMLLEHLFAGAVMRHLWLDGYSRVEMLKPQVDDSGYDLVLEANSVVRHIQLKASHNLAATPRVSVHLGLSEKPSGCVIWLRFDETTLDFGPFLWFGGEPGAKFPDISEEKVTTYTKANAQGVKLPRSNHRYLPKARFTPLKDIPEVVERLFGSKAHL